MKRLFLLGVLFLNCHFALGQAQYTVLYNFGANGGATDGYLPNEGIVFDAAGNLYGTTNRGGSNCQGPAKGCGTVFELTTSQGGGWTENVIWNFCPAGNQPFCADGEYPGSGLIIDGEGNLYGVAGNGGTYGLGVVFELVPPSIPGGAWTQITLWNFSDLPNGPLIMDSAGNLYGTTYSGGPGCCGSVFELSLVGGGWALQTLYGFTYNNGDGAYPLAGVTFDSLGNLYGTTQYGGDENTQGCVRHGCGTIFELSQQAGGAWQETVLYRFTGVEVGPISGVNVDQADDIYGTVSGNRESNGGVFKFSAKAGMSILRFNGQDGAYPTAALLIRRGVAYGEAAEGGTNGYGVVFELTQKQKTVLYNFCSQPNCADGSYPGGGGSLVYASGNLYGTASMGGAFGQGVVFGISH